jgi:hypothetical protein
MKILLFPSAAAEEGVAVVQYLKKFFSILTTIFGTITVIISVLLIPFKTITPLSLSH